MAHAPDEHHPSNGYHHLAGKEKRAHEGSQSPAPGKQATTEGSGNFNDQADQ